MSDFTKEQKLGLLKRGLQRRLVGMNPTIEQKEQEITKIKEIRQSYVGVIEENKDNDLITRVFNAQLKEFDRQYGGSIQNYESEIEDIKETAPIAKELLGHLENIESGKEDETVLFLMLELFFKPILTDWYELEESQKEEEKTKNVKQ